MGPSPLTPASVGNLLTFHIAISIAISHQLKVEALVKRWLQLTGSASEGNLISDKNKTGFLSSYGRVGTTVSLNHLNHQNKQKIHGSHTRTLRAVLNKS